MWVSTQPWSRRQSKSVYYLRGLKAFNVLATLAHYLRGLKAFNVLAALATGWPGVSGLEPTCGLPYLTPGPPVCCGAAVGRPHCVMCPPSRPSRGRAAAPVCPRVAAPLPPALLDPRPLPQMREPVRAPVLYYLRGRSICSYGGHAHADMRVGILCAAVPPLLLNQNLGKDGIRCAQCSFSHGLAQTRCAFASMGPPPC